MFTCEFIETDLIDVPEKSFSADFISNMLYLYCDSAMEARAIQNTLQSLDGSNIERDGAFLYCTVENMDNAIQELEETGFNWEEVC